MNAWLRYGLLLAVAVAAPVAVAAAFLPLRGYFSIANVALVMVVAVVPVAFAWWMAGIVAAVCAALAFDFFWTPPLFTLNTWYGQDLAGTALYLAVGLVVGELARENRRHRAKAEGLASEQAALRRVATLVARRALQGKVFAAVAEEVGRLADASTAQIFRYEPDGSIVRLAAWGRGTKDFQIGARYPTGGHGVLAMVLHSGTPARIDDTGEDGGNIMSLIFSTGQPVRIGEYAQASGELADLGRASGFGSAVGVPITVEGRVWGVMMVSLEHERPWPAGTEQRLAKFTELAATAIANGAAREELRRVADEQAALRRVATLVARGVAPDVVFDAVAEEVGNLLPATNVAVVGRYTSDQSIQFVGGWSAADEVSLVGTSARLGGRNTSTAVFESRQPARVDLYGEDVYPVSAIARGTGARSSIGAPINVEGRLWGVIAVGSTHEAALPAGTETRLAQFTELVGTAIANAESRGELAASRARVVAAADESRRRIVRDLHDGAQHRLVQTIITLSLAQRAQERGDGQGFQALFGEALGQAGQANTELRELAQGILPSVLARGGLRAGVEELIEQLRVPVTVEVTRDRFPAEVEANAYFVVAEALTNLAKHSRARGGTVAAWAEGKLVHVEVRDDGVGGARPAGAGLRGLADRVAALGGELRIDSPPGCGTRLTATLPLARAGPSRPA